MDKQIHIDQLTITLNYNEEIGIPAKYLSDYILGINKAYNEASGTKNNLYVKSISKGSIKIKLITPFVTSALFSCMSYTAGDFGRKY